jgi:hypothetical protein
LRFAEKPHAPWPSSELRTPSSSTPWPVAPSHRPPSHRPTVRNGQPAPNKHRAQLRPRFTDSSRNSSIIGLTPPRKLGATEQRRDGKSEMGVGSWEMGGTWLNNCGRQGVRLDVGLLKSRIEWAAVSLSPIDGRRCDVREGSMIAPESTRIARFFAFWPLLPLLTSVDSPEVHRREPHAKVPKLAKKETVRT